MIPYVELVFLPVDDDGGDLLVHEDQDGTYKNKQISLQKGHTRIPRHMFSTAHQVFRKKNMRDSGSESDLKKKLKFVLRIF